MLKLNIFKKRFFPLLSHTLSRLFILFAVFGAFGALFDAAPQATSKKKISAGNYKTADTNAAEIRAAAKSAVDAQARASNITIELLNVERAKKQIGAEAVNYKLCLTVDIYFEEVVAKTLVKVIVSKKQGTSELIWWQETNCADHPEFK